jgi:hypothetical protein
VRPSLIVAAALVAACASAGPPPGGPEDKLPPRVVRVTPDTNAVNVRDRVATFYFDEIINDRGEGAGDISNFFLVSPSDGAPRVSWHRRRIEVRPRRGFRENTAYTITLLPGLGDLRSNVMKDGATVVFATGATIPTLRITGTAFDWVAERVAPRALVEAITPDSVVYLAQADSVGRFVVGPLGPGSYLVRAVIDQNSNRALDRTEAWDSVRVTAPQATPVELLVAPRDTLPARLTSVTSIDSVTLRLTFDRLLDPAQEIPVANVRLVGADSVAIPVTAARTPREELQQAEARTRAAADSARRADSLAGNPRPAVPAATATPARPPALADAKPSRPAPFTSVTISLARPLAPNKSYRASITTVRALSGRATASERAFTTPKPAPPPTAADSAARRAAPPGTAPNATPGATPGAVPSVVPLPGPARPASPSPTAPPARP